MGLRFGKPKRIVRRGKRTSRYYVRVTGSGIDTLRNTGVSTLKDAQRVVSEWAIAEAMTPQRRRDQERAEVLLDDAVEAWLEDKRRSLRPRTFDGLRRHVHRFWLGEDEHGQRRGFFHGRQLTDISRNDLRAYFRKRETGTLPGTLRRTKVTQGKPPRKSGPVGPRTLDLDRAHLGNFFKWALANELVDRSPVLGLPTFKGEAESYAHQLTDDDERKLIAACRDSEIIEVEGNRNGARGPRQWKQTIKRPLWLAPFVICALNSGLRRSTLCSLLWRHVDLERANWNIPGSLLKSGKPYKQPISPVVVKELREYRQRIADTSGADRLRGDAPVFDPKDPASVSKAFQAAARRAGLNSLRLHGLRSAFVNKLRRAGVSLDAALELIGHSSYQTTLAHYVVVDEAETRAAVAALNSTTGDQGARENA